MAIFRATVDVHNVASYPSTPQVTIPFEPRTITVFNEDNDEDDAYVSVDGINDHGHVFPGVGLTLTQRCTKIWLRHGETDVDSSVISITAES